MNGFGGVDFLDADTDGYRRAGEALLETGVTAYLPTFITAPEEQLLAALRGVPTGAGRPADPRRPPRRPVPLAAAARDASAQPRAATRTSRCSSACSRPGPSGSSRSRPSCRARDELVETLAARARSPSRAATRDATADEANAAFDAGVRTVTHLFNAMRPFSHRDPGIAGAALARDDVVVQIILDGVHLAPETASVVLAGGAPAASRS